jgi:hypothetical protein
VRAGRQFLFAGVLLIVVFAALAIRRWQHKRELSRLYACVGNLMVLEQAKEHYAAEHGLTNGATIDPLALEPWTMKRWEYEICPSAGTNTYTIGRIGDWPECRIHGRRPDDLHLPGGKNPDSFW